MQVAIRDWLLSIPFEGAFGTAQELGFDGLEVCFGENYREHPLMYEGGIEGAQALTDLTGCPIATFEAHALIGRSFTNPDEGLRSEGVNFVNRLCRLAPQFDVPVIVITCFGEADIAREDVDDPLLIRGLRRVGEVAGKYRVALALETTLPGEDACRLLDAVDTDSVRICYDVGNAVRDGHDGPRELRELGDRVVCAHMKDSTRGTGDHDLGEGGVDFDAVADALAAVGYDGWLVLDTPPSIDALASARKNLLFTRRLADRISST
jgi:hexulose-6-phosphate isomerase